MCRKILNESKRRPDRVAFYLRLSTSWDRIHKPDGRLSGAVLIVDLHELHFRELFEVVREQVRDRIRCTGAITRPGEVDVSHTVDEFKTVIASEAIR